MSDFKAIIFDLGNVVFNCSFNETITYWAKVSNQDKEQLENRLDLNQDSVHDLFEKADIPPIQFKEHISKKIEFDLSIPEFEKGWNAIYGDEIVGIKELLKNLKNRYRIIALTNTNEIHSKVWTKKFHDTLKIFEKVFISNEIKTRKPESTAFQICLDYLGFHPSKIVFLDDKIEYIIGAENLGIKGILVSSFEKMINDLNAIGIRTSGNNGYIK
jgi:glucose-1-phosphatase